MEGAEVWNKRTPEDTIPTSYDAYVFQKTYTPRFIETARSLKYDGKVVIFDLCDAEWVNPAREKNLREMLSVVDYVTTSSEFIRQYIVKNYHKLCRFIPDRLDLDTVPKTKEHTGKTSRVIWFGNRNTIAYLNMFNDILWKVNHDSPFTLVLMSDEFDAYTDMGGSDKPEIEKVKWEEKKANDVILGCDVVLNPHGVDDDIGKAKSDNKTTLSWALGLPVVSHGNFHRIESLLITYLRKPELRKTVGKIGRNMVEQLYDACISAVEFTSVIKEASWNMKKN